MKQPDWKIPLVLATSLVVLGSFAYWLQYSHKPKQTRADSQQKKPLALPNEDAQIVQFRIKSASGVIEGRCDSLAEKTCKPSTPGKWTITYPETFKGDAASIKDVLTNATSMLATDTIDLSDETPEKRKKLLEEYGLNDEQRTKIGSEFLEITLQDGKKLTAWFGEQYPIGDKVFVGSAENSNLNDKTIFVVANFYKGVFSKPLTYFRNKSAFEFNRSDITDISAKTTQGKLDAHFENGAWTINGKKGDYDHIQMLLSAVLLLKAKEFPDANVLKKAHVVCSYEIKSKTDKYSFELLESDSKPIKMKGHPEIPGESHFYVTASTLKGPIEVDANFKNQIDKKLNDLRYSQLLSQTEKATATVIALDGKNLEGGLQFHYDGKAWAQKSTAEKTVAKTVAKIDVTKVQHMLEDISAERAMDIVSPAPALSDDAITVSIGDDKNANKAHFVVYAIKNLTYAKDLTQTTNEAFLITQTEKNSFPFDLASWKLK
jgi:hypothetical protein